MQYSSGGTPIFSGSSVDAGATPAIVRLDRGGQVRVCPQTSVAIRASRGATGAAPLQHLLLSLDTGSLEINYSLGASADSIVTPDFRIVVAGPGDFRLAVGADVRGDACVRTFSGNSAAILISEMMGDGTYQLKPNDSVSFHGGRISDFSPGAPACGCPQAPPVLTAGTVPSPSAKSAAPSPTSTEIQSSSSAPQFSAQLSSQAEAAPAQPPAPVGSAISAQPAPDATLTTPAPAANPGEVHVQVEAPVVFQAAAPEPDAALLEQLPINGSALPVPQVTPPPAPASRHHGFLGRLRGFFAAMFGH